MTKLRTFSLLAMIALLSSCAISPTIDSDAWPQEIPERDYYVDAYNADLENQQWQEQNDYLRWVVRFYRGWALYPRGWQWLTAQVCETVEGGEKDQLMQTMASLGERISSEWAKDRRGRTVNTTHLMIWGDALKLAVKEQGQLELANQISTDVDDLLANRIKPDVIALSRYFNDDDEQSDIAHEEGLDDFDDPFGV